MGITKRKRGAAGGRPELVDPEDCRMEHAAALSLLADEVRAVSSFLPVIAGRLHIISNNDLSEERRQAAVLADARGLGEEFRRIVHHVEARTRRATLVEMLRRAHDHLGRLAADLDGALRQDRLDDPLQADVRRDLDRLHQRLDAFAARLERDAEGLRKSDLRREEP